MDFARNIVLFLDDLPEFRRRSLKVLRQVPEQGVLTISRALRSTTFPARFALVAAMNPYPCGYLGDPRHAGKCLPQQVEKYVGRVSGPLLYREERDRIWVVHVVEAIGYRSPDRQRWTR